MVDKGRPALQQGSDWILDSVRVREGEAVLAAAEGGDRVLRLLGARPRRIAAVDHNRAQLFLLELKLAGVKSLARGEYLELVGLRPSPRRRALYQRARWLVSPEADEYWLGNLALIDRGLALEGKFERRLASFRRVVRLVQGSSRVERFQALLTPEERREAYGREWQTFLWRRLGAPLWKRWFDVPVERLDRLLLEGRLMASPPELEEGEFVMAKELANRVLVVHEPPESYLGQLPERSVDAFVLGRLRRGDLEPQLARAAAPGARMSFVTEREAPWEFPGFVPGEPSRDAGFFPGWLVAGSLGA
jgi:S-adenosylmethionine:diacylglycerol 3-amino-3-carboxypropyl transferase